MTNNIYNLDELLAYSFTPASEFGFDNIIATIQRRLDYLNGQVNDMTSLFSEKTTDRRRVWGSSTANTMVEITDDLGSANSRTVAPGVEVNFPLRKFSVKTGWTSEWLKRATPAEIAKRYLAAEAGYLTRMIDEIKFSIFNKTNYSVNDFLIDNTSLAVKAFINADSAAIPAAPDGTSFTASSHQHYVGTSGGALAYTDIDTLISNVQEHGLKGLALFINGANVSTLANLATTKFTALTHAVIAVPGITSGTVVKDDPANDDKNNKLVGYWDGVPVYTKPFVPAAYVACVALGASEKPLVWRVDKISGNQGFIAEVPFGMHPITAQEYVAYYGFGAWNRAAVACLKTDAQTTYTNPSLIR